jgi:hypothetical protein
MRSLLAACGVCAATALVLVSASVAAPPVAQTLNPPAPSYYTCNTVGNGTICDGQPPVETWSGIDTADEGTPIACGSGPTAFHVYDSGTDQVTARRVYDENGNLVRRVLRDDYSFGEFSNPVSGATVPYGQTDIRTSTLAVPGELGTATETITWNIHFHAAGAGAPVFVHTGRSVQSPDGTIEFRAGRLQFFDLVVDGDTSVLGPLCSALEAG